MAKQLSGIRVVLTRDDKGMWEFSVLVDVGSSDLPEAVVERRVDMIPVNDGMTLGQIKGLLEAEIDLKVIKTPG